MPGERSARAATIGGRDIASIDRLTSVIPWTQTDARRWWQENGAAILDLQRRSLADTVEFVSHATAAPGSVVSALK